MDLLCIDCEKNYEQGLTLKGHRVHSGKLGYKSGVRFIETPPHEAEVVIHNLEKPACFDMGAWGPDGGNDNFKCNIVKEPKDAILISHGKHYPRYPLIFRSHIRSARVGTHLGFGPEDILRGAQEAGTVILVFLNESYMKHVTVGEACYDAPSIFGEDYEVQRTRAAQYAVQPTVAKYLPLLGTGDLRFQPTLKYKLGSRISFGHSNMVGEVRWIVQNRVGDTFGWIVPLSRGFACYLPECESNLRVSEYLLENIDAVRDLYKELTEPAQTIGAREAGALDELTGMLRRGALERGLQETIDYCTSRKHPVSLAMIDLDHFKRVNDTHGHPAGDDVLKAAASLLKEIVGNKGNLIRYGGEEIALVLPNFSLDESLALAERLRKEVEDNAFVVSEGKVPLSLTVSIGVATSIEKVSGAALIKQADKALYNAKQKGRNRVEAFMEQ